MKIYERIEIDMVTGAILDEQSFEYEGPVALCGGGGGGKGSTPKVTPTPAKPATEKDTTNAVNAAVSDQQDKQRKYMGQNSTILTSPLGAPPNQQGGKTLLGQ